jgi:hypothetical protein
MSGKLTLSVALLLCSVFAWSQSLPIKPGTVVHLTMTSAATSKAASGSPFTAILSSPLHEDGATMLPEGTLFEGHLQAVRARRLQKGGSLRLVFDRLRLANGAILPVNLSVISLQLQGSKVDQEGTIRQRRSKKRLLVDIGGVALAAKLSDDAAELATSFVNKGMARLFGLAGAAAFVLLQRGTDVKIPAGTGVDAAFTREMSQAPSAGGGSQLAIAAPLTRSQQQSHH